METVKITTSYKGTTDKDVCLTVNSVSGQATLLFILVLAKAAYFKVYETVLTFSFKIFPLPQSPRMPIAYHGTYVFTAMLCCSQINNIIVWGL